jgi:hypothetical protein
MINLQIITQENPQEVDGHYFNRFFARGSDGRYYTGWFCHDEDEIMGGN